VQLTDSGHIARAYQAGYHECYAKSDGEVQIGDPYSKAFNISDSVYVTRDIHFVRDTCANMSTTPLLSVSALTQTD
jgi:hypothetical protein